MNWRIFVRLWVSILVIDWILNHFIWSKEISAGDILLATMGSIATFAVWWWNSRYRPARPFTLQRSFDQYNDPIPHAAYVQSIYIDKPDIEVIIRVYCRTACCLDKLNVRLVEGDNWRIRDWIKEIDFVPIKKDTAMIANVFDREMADEQPYTGRVLKPKPDDRGGFQIWYVPPRRCARKTYFWLTIRILSAKNWNGFISLEQLEGVDNRGKGFIAVTAHLPP